MIQVDAALVAIFITILISLIGMGAAWGSLRERVKTNTEDIDANYNQNREDHQMMFKKLSEIQRDLRNGNRHAGKN